MSDFAMWGPEQSGPRLAEQDALKAQQSLATTAGTLETARLHGAQADSAELDVANKRRMQDLLLRRAQGEVVGGNNMADQLTDVFNMQLGAGLVSEAEKTARAVGYLKGKAAQIDNWQSTQKINQLKADKLRADSAAALAADVTDQDSFDRANALFQFSHGTPSPYAGLPYSPELLERIQAGAVSVSRQIELQMRAEENASKERNRVSAESLRKVREQDIQERSRLAKEREERLAKAGGGKVPTTPTEDIRQATRLIAKDYPKLEGGAAEAASTIAAEAQMLLRRNPALDRASAIQQAYNAARLRGDFQEQPGGFLSSDKQKFESGGKTADNPIALPSDGKGMVAGRYYSNKSGQVGLYQANGKLKLVSPSAAPRSALPLSPNNTNEDNDAEPDDDGDD